MIFMIIIKKKYLYIISKWLEEEELELLKEVEPKSPEEMKMEREEEVEIMLEREEEVEIIL